MNVRPLWDAPTRKRVIVVLGALAFLSHAPEPRFEAALEALSEPPERHAKPSVVRLVPAAP